MSKRFTGLSKDERENFEKLLLGLAFKHSSEADMFYSAINGNSESAQDLQTALHDLTETTQKIANRKKKSQSEDFSGEGYNKTPKQIKEVLDRFVIGQDEAKRVLSVAFFNHARRIASYDEAVSLGKELDFMMNKSNVIMLGPTGTGKTYLVDILSKIFDVPFYCADASTITQAGFVGKSANDMIEQLYLKSNKDIKKTERGIIFLDEIDKLATNKEGKQNSMVEGAQQSLLKIIEGTDIEIEAGGMDKSKKIVINTKNILFVLAGAFVGLVGDKPNAVATIGFDSFDEKDMDIDKVMPPDLVKYGIIPELVGRISMIAQMHQLKEEHLVEILKSSKNNVIQQYQNMFSSDKIDINFAEDVYMDIASKAIELKTGARSLKSIVDYLMVDKIYDIELEGNNKTKVIDIDKEYTNTKLSEFKTANKDLNV